MGKTKYSILIIEDNDTMRDGMVQVIKKMGHSAQLAENAEDGFALFEKQKFHLVISDYKLPGMNGVDLLQKVKKKTPESEVLMITAYGTIELAVEAMQKGASDFITKPFSPEELSLKIERILQRIDEKVKLQTISDENIYLRQQIDDQFNFGEIIGKSEAMLSIFKMIEKVAQGDSSVIIYGESGTGKELVARAIHKASSRKDNPLIRVNCGALAEGVLESELFGHEKGAFTGAIKRKKGRFELAHNSSIFLDEIGDIPLSTQVRLLRFLQEKEFERVGGEESISVDVRVISATNKNLQEEINAGRFREDLYYRLHIIPITLPPLRKRKEDIVLLAEHFTKKIAQELNKPDLQIVSSALEALQMYDWPGNVREFENVLERGAVLCEGNQICLSDLPFHENQNSTTFQLSGDNIKLNESLENLEKQLLQRALDKAKGVKTEAARLLGVKTSALYYKLEKYNLL